MLRLGVFGGRYMTDGRGEFPKSWFTRAKLAKGRRGRDVALNYFGVDASQPLSEWRKKGWIHEDDPRGWFQWYCRYYMGRRMPDEDRRQIKRWKHDQAACAADREELRARRRVLPAAAAPGAAALGLRQPQDLSLSWRKRYCGSRGSVPLGEPSAAKVSFSTFASAWRSSRSQCSFSTSPRS